MSLVRCAGSDRLSVVAQRVGETGSVCRELGIRGQRVLAAARETKASARRNRLRAIEIRYAVRRSRRYRYGPLYAMSDGPFPVPGAVSRIRCRANLLAIWQLTPDRDLRAAIEIELYGVPDGERAREEGERLAGLTGPRPE